MPKLAPVTRDEQIASEISDAENVVAALAHTLGGLSDHATQHHADGHAALYEAVQASLASAEKQLRRALEVMTNGDAADYL